MKFNGPGGGRLPGRRYEDGNAATHQFISICLAAGMAMGRRGGELFGADHATISRWCGHGAYTALLAPDWVPWEQRVRPGDLSPEDLQRRRRMIRGWFPLPPVVMRRLARPPQRSG